MKTLPPGLQDHLDTGATTLCHCWRVTRQDGAILGFTDHDETLVFDGVAFEAQSGLNGSEAVTALGLRVGNAEVNGAFSSDRIAICDLMGGIYDGARVEVWLVNWQALDQRVLMSVATAGEVRTEDGAFQVELRGPAQALQRKGGRIFSHVCSASVGDARCGVDLNAASYRGDGSVTAIDGARTLSASGLDAFADGWFRQGLLRWTTGANTGASVEVKAHERRMEGAKISLWHRTAKPIAVGDTFEVTAGCDKQFATCRAKFANAVNFRGFPHMPGNDFAITYPTSGEVNDGAPTR